MDNQLGPHGPGYHAIIIEGPDDNPTGFSLLTISHDNGIYEYQGGEPTQGYIELLDTAILMRNDHFLYQEHVGYTTPYEPIDYVDLYSEGDPNAGGDPNDPNAGGDSYVPMAVFDLMDNQLGPHGPGYHAIIIEGPDDNPTGFSLLTIYDNGIYEYQGGEPTQGYIELLDTAILMRNDHFLYQEHVGYTTPYEPIDYVDLYSEGDPNAVGDPKRMRMVIHMFQWGLRSYGQSVGSDGPVTMPLYCRS